MKNLNSSMAKLGLSPSGDATQAVVRTRDAVGHFLFVVLGRFSPTPDRSIHFESGTPAPESINHLCALDTTAHRATSLVSLSGALATHSTSYKNERSSLSAFFDKPSTCFVLAFVCLVIYFMNPVKAHAAWVYYPPETVISYVQANDPITGTLFQISFVPIGTGVFDVAAHKVVDIASLPVASQPPLNPIMLGMPTINYGGLPSSLDPLNPANAVQIGQQFAEYGSYMLGVSVLGLFLGMSFGGLLGLIRKNTQVI